MKEYKVKEIPGDVSAFEKELNFQANYGWSLHSFEVLFAGPGCLKYIAVFVREKN